MFTWLLIKVTFNHFHTYYKGSCFLSLTVKNKLSVFKPVMTQPCNLLKSPCFFFFSWFLFSGSMILIFDYFKLFADCLTITSFLCMILSIDLVLWLNFTNNSFYPVISQCQSNCSYKWLKHMLFIKKSIDTLL